MTLTVKASLSRTKDDMDAAVRADDVAHLANLECIGCVLERLLHLALHQRSELRLQAVMDGILTLPKLPRSPPFLADEQSEWNLASSVSFSGWPLISLW